MRKADIECVAGLKLLYEPNSVIHKALLLATSDGRGKPNIMPFTSWFFQPLDPQGWSFSIYVFVGHHSHDLIKRSGQYTVNLPREGMKDIEEYCGSVSGRDHDKFKECGLTAVDSRCVIPPIIDECRVHFECDVEREYPFLMTFPGQDKKAAEMTVFESRVLAAYADK